eukprot:scaffold160635_cov22-Tisochrysis_lutea.AAC.1
MPRGTSSPVAATSRCQRAEFYFHPQKWGLPHEERQPLYSQVYGMGGLVSRAPSAPPPPTR